MKNIFYDLGNEVFDNENYEEAIKLYKELLEIEGEIPIVPNLNR